MGYRRRRKRIAECALRIPLAISSRRESRRPGKDSKLNRHQTRLDRSSGADFSRTEGEGETGNRLSSSSSAVYAEKWMLCTEHHFSSSCATTCACWWSPGRTAADGKEQHRRRPILDLRRPTLIDLFISTVVSCFVSNRIVLWHSGRLVRALVL